MSKHLHKYIRAKLGKQIIYRCILPGCPHWILKALIENRTSVCNRCGNPFVITKRTLKNCPAKPHCESCYKKKEDDTLLDQTLDTII